MSGIVGSRLNIRGSGVVGKLGTDGQVLTSSGAGESAVFEAASGFTVSSITGATALGATPADTDEFVLSDAGTLKRMDYSHIKGITAANFRPNAKPLIINGDMAVAQRSTSATGKTANGYYTCDRFKLNVSSLGTWTVAQETLSSGNAYADGFQKAFRIDCTTADASPSSGDSLLVNYSLEGQDVQCIKKGTANAEKLTLAFWVKSNKTGTAQVNVRDMDNTRMCSGTYVISSADTWEKKVINIAADTTGVFGMDNAESLRLQFWLDAGSNFTSGAIPTAWEATATADLSVSDLALGDNTANDWAITGVQLEVGEYTSSTIPPFQHESYGENLRRCSRYYQLILSGAEDTDGSFLNFTSYNGAGVYSSQMYPMGEMRAAPTGITSDNTDDFKMWTASTTYASPSLGFNHIVKKGSWISTTLTSAPTQGYSLFSAALNSTTLCAFEAEL